MRYVIRSINYISNKIYLSEYRIYCDNDQRKIESGFSSDKKERIIFSSKEAATEILLLIQKEWGDYSSYKIWKLVPKKKLKPPPIGSIYSCFGSLLVIVGFNENSGNVITYDSTFNGVSDDCSLEEFVLNVNQGYFVLLFDNSDGKLKLDDETIKNWKALKECLT